MLTEQGILCLKQGVNLTLDIHRFPNIRHIISDHNSRCCAAYPDIAFFHHNKAAGYIRNSSFYHLGFVCVFVCVKGGDKGVLGWDGVWKVLDKIYNLLIDQVQVGSVFDKVDI